MFIVEFEDGTAYSELNGHWKSVPQKKIKKLVVINPVDKKFYSLSGYDTYLFTKEAVHGSLSGNRDVAIWAGGFYEPSGDGFVLKIVLNDLAYQGNAFGLVPSNHKDWYPMNRKDLGFGKTAYKTNL